MLTVNRTPTGWFEHIPFISFFSCSFSPWHNSLVLEYLERKETRGKILRGSSDHVGGLLIRYSKVGGRLVEFFL